jgi:hypothetical protein
MLDNLITYRTANRLTLADILRAHWADYQAKYPVSPEQAKVVGAVMACRTPALGGRLDQCAGCGAWVFSFNSCRDRHCNQCQKFEKAQWVEKQQVYLLPIPYFHVVFTTDHAINPLVPANRAVIYTLLFKSASQSLQKLAKKERGCRLGITAVLHTWGQQLDQHIHLHCIVSGGGPALDGRGWRSSLPHYLVDVVALSADFRDRFGKGLRRLYRRGKLKLVGAAAELDVEAVVDQMLAKKWEVFAKPFDQPQTVIAYLSRYVHQGAISNHRLLKLARGQVQFEYYDNRDLDERGQGKKKGLTLAAVEFIRRWLRHLLPPGFVRIRYYGLHHASARAETLPECRAHFQLGRALPVVEALVLVEWLQAILGEAYHACPHCGAPGTLFRRTEFEALPWLVRLLLSLLGRPTRQGVGP